MISARSDWNLFSSMLSDSDEVRQFVGGEEGGDLGYHDHVQREPEQFGKILGLEVCVGRDLAFDDECPLV
eukprot:CAMPEP_0194409972 /NCGR_PEP_ID=MMETSP0176-20130528/7932_1 /TAXON_ID=216777 /ORGANISM="Proboscia alata, Strain PI-D3" /LENGTH=69 /DNA_ID=CAMNT_0039210949 /DNA_START=883 /DNA_END=1092 /DNA_ORIENTATION=+